MHIRILILAAGLVALTTLAGCTDGPDDPTDDQDPDQPGDTNGTNDTPPQPVVQEVRLTGAYPATIAYDPASIQVPEGSVVTIRFTNSDQAPVFNHDWVLEGHEENASTEVIGNGQTSEVTFAAPPVGTYAFYCSVPGHRDNGMEGTFEVTAGNGTA